MKILKFWIFSLSIFVSTIGKGILACEGGWEPYKDEKCLKTFVISELHDYEEAEKFCRDKYDGTLASIPDEEKQKFIENYLKSQNIVDYIWIGLQYVSNNQYVWVDDSDIEYTNWAINSPRNDPQYCVQIQTDNEEFGRWSEVLCDKKNSVTLCEKVQVWSSSTLQNEVINLRKGGKKLQEKVRNLEENPVPVDFIYAQVPGQEEPQKIWPQLSWKDISEDYQGLFFRVVGNGSASFGEVQEDNSPRLVRIKRVEASSYLDVAINADGRPSSPIDADDSTWSDRALQFTVSAGEVRPRNKAIKIWKRVE